MARFTFNLANSADDLDLQKTIENNPLDGKMRLSFARSPSFFHGVGILGKKNEIIVARDTDNGALAALAISSTRNAFVNGVKREIGYLSGLRVEPAYRNGTILARGYRFLRQLYETNPVPFYLAAITEDNIPALKALTGKKRPIPNSRDLGRYCTLVFSLRNNHSSISYSDLEIKLGSSDCLSEMVTFINLVNSQRQFAPCYQDEDFLNKSLFRGLELKDFYLAYRKGRLVGVLARWDQRRYKQIRIIGYDWRLACSRPIVNLIARARGLPLLPKPGSDLDSFYVSCVAVSPHEPDVFQGLVAYLHNDHSRKDYSLMMLGLHSEDPLLQVARRFPHLEYKSRIWMMYWPDQQREAEAVNGEMIPFIELATL